MNDEPTLVNVGDFGFARSMLLHQPQLRWVDSVGSHSYLVQGRRMIGSADDCDIIVRDGEVSRLHASLEVTSDGAWVRDLGSRNGTFVNGVRVREAQVPDGGCVHLGSCDLWLFYNQNAAELELWPFERFGPLWGRSARMRELFAQLYRVALLDSTVLVLGETGTGKELVARAIHEASPRVDKPFVVVDCGALAESLLEVELFGNAKGAYTGAMGARAGAIESADGGTVFLDEIGEMPLSMQPKLLRALEGRMVRRVGETQYRSVNVRFIAATHRDLASMVNLGTFREDLYFRLSVVPLTVPPLRDRLDDIPLLVEKLLPPGAQDVVTPDLLRELRQRPWAGNVRELRNFVERALALGVRGALNLAGVRREEKGGPLAPASEGALPGVNADEPFKLIRDRWLDHLELTYLRTMIERHKRDTSAIAQASGLDRSYVYRLMRKHEL
jgi:two-component system, NtrC family, response regulator GlrR